MSAYLDTIRYELHAYKVMTERAVAQVSDEQLYWKPDDEANSIAIIMQHMAGNMESRWTDFLTTDGEKDWRDRDGEFVDGHLARGKLMGVWEAGWATCLAAINGLSDDDLQKTATIRDEVYTVMGAIQRQLAHYAYHVGQITWLARSLVGPGWQTLSLARNK